MLKTSSLFPVPCSLVITTIFNANLLIKYLMFRVRLYSPNT
ncbi:MAG: hypothetical protein ACK57T_06030 [Dolichospermum sp.]